MNYDDDGRVRLGHSGAFDLGAATAVTLLPAESLGIVVLTNAAPIGVPEAVSASFFDLVLKGKIEKDWLAVFGPIFAALAKPAYGTATDDTKPPALKSPPLPSETYLGTYRNDYFGDLEVVEQDGALLLRIGPKMNNDRHRAKSTAGTGRIGHGSATHQTANLCSKLNCASLPRPQGRAGALNLEDDSGRHEDLGTTEITEITERRIRRRETRPRRWMPLTDLPGILSVISVISVVGGVCVSVTLRCLTPRFPGVS